MSFYYKPEWCLYAASEVERNQAAKKRFVDEYESDVCYRKEAKNLSGFPSITQTSTQPKKWTTVALQRLWRAHTAQLAG